MSGSDFRPRLGILGGLGPLASADLHRKVIELTPAASDTEHIPQVLLSLPQIPDRSTAVLSGTDAPLPALIHGIKTLNGLGVEVIAIACNTAHHWHERISAASRAKVLHIADCSIGELKITGHRRVVVMATRGTLASGFYQQRLRLAGHVQSNPNTHVFQRAVDDTIAAVKSGHLIAAKETMRMALAQSRDCAADAVILACTELPIAIEGLDCSGLVVIDSNAALARACVRQLGYASVNQ